MPRLITTTDMAPGDEPVLDSAAYWVRLPDGSRARDAAGRLLAFRHRENAAYAAKQIDAQLESRGQLTGATAVPPEPHELTRSGAPQGFAVGADFVQVKGYTRKRKVAPDSVPAKGHAKPSSTLEPPRSAALPEQ